MKFVRLILALAVLALPLTVSACGKKTRPEYPEGSTFPDTYPRH